MPDDAPVETTETPTPAEAVTTPTPAPAPAYVTVDQFQTMMTQMQENFQASLQQTVAQVQAGMRPTVVEHDEPEPTDEEIDAAALEGKGVGAAVKRAVRASQKQLARQTQAAVGEVSDVGLPALAEIALETAKTKWGEDYTRYQKEIDAGLSQLPIALRAKPSNLQFVFDTVLGRHDKERRAEAVEQATRSLRENPDSLLPPGRKNPKGQESLDPAKVFGDEDYNTLKRHGKDVETLAKKLGKTPEQYLAGVKRYNDRMRGAA